MVKNSNHFLNSLTLSSDKTENAVAIVVTHLVADANNFLMVIKKLFHSLIIIPKKSSKTDDMVKNYSMLGHILDINRFDISNKTNDVMTSLDTIINGKKFIIFDMGGYFSSIVDILSLRKEQLIGIIEDTENGHLRYLNLIQNETKYNFPIISVARSSLKEPEDILVGQSIAFSIERILRSRLSILINKFVLVIGYGKIGAGICQALHGRGANVHFYDVDPLKTVKGLALGFKSGEKNSLLSMADLIISATGNKGLSRKSLSEIKNGAYIFTATSPDDEFENCLLDLCHISSSDNQLIQINMDNPNKTAYLCNKGNAINFSDGSVVDRYIELVQAEMLFAIKELSICKVGCISEIKNDKKRFIAKKWLNFYSSSF